MAGVPSVHSDERDGVYKGWKGSGRWASFDEKQGYADHYFVR
jgi:hypothetical protein